MQPINLQEMDLKTLKAMAYDFIAQKEDAERNLQAVNNEILVRINHQNNIPASDSNSLVNSTEDNKLIT